jgi:hypothetical protein
VFIPLTLSIALMKLLTQYAHMVGSPDGRVLAAAALNRLASMRRSSCLHLPRPPPRSPRNSESSSRCPDQPESEALAASCQSQPTRCARSTSLPRQVHCQTGCAGPSVHHACALRTPWHYPVAHSSSLQHVPLCQGSCFNIITPASP